MPFVVLSPELAVLSPMSNARLYDAMAETLHRFFPEALPALGMYKSRVEKSFVVPLHDDEEYEHIRELAVEFKQESILLVDDDLEANLVMLKDGEIVDLGHWVYAGTMPPDANAWTLVGNAYFYCV